MKYLEKIYNVNILGLIFMVFIKEFITSDYLTIAETVFLSLVVISCILLARGPSLYFSLIALILGHLFLFKYDLGYEIWLDGLTKNLPLAILFVVVPILSIPLKLGGYLQVFNTYLSNFKNKTSGLFLFLTGFVTGLSSITNLGSIGITDGLVKEVNFPAKFLAKVYAVGVVTSMVWSPYFGSVNLTLYYTGVSYSKYFLFGIFYGVSLFTLGNFLFYNDKTCQAEVKSSFSRMKQITGSNTKIKELAFNLIGLFVVVIIGERMFSFSSIMLLVSMVAVFYAFGWSAFINQFKQFLNQIKKYNQITSKVINEILFFLSVGFFGVILANTPLQNYIENFFRSISGFSTFFLVETIILLTLILASIGIHHIITITAIGLSLNPDVLGLNNIAFALTLMGAYVVSTIMSPFVIFNIIVGGLLKINTFVIGLKWNRAFGIFVIIFSGFYVVLVNIFI